MAREFGETLQQEMREFLEQLLRFDSISGNESEAQHWIAQQIDNAEFDEKYIWTPNVDTVVERLPMAESPADLDVDVEDIPIVAGIVELGDPDEGPTIVLNGHVDVVPADSEQWSNDPFEPVSDGDAITARGSVDMKSGLAAAFFGARYAAESGADLDGRIVFESVPGEEIGGTGAIASAFDAPYGFDRDGVVIGEASGLRLSAASQGSVWKRLELFGQTAHSSSPWRGESVLPHFERIRRAFRELESERSERVSHPYFERYETKWPMNIGNVQTKPEDARKVPDYLQADFRLGVSPNETLDSVEAEYQAKLDEVTAESDWLSENRPNFEHMEFQIAPSAVEPDDPLVTAFQDGMRKNGIEETDPDGLLGGADTRHYIAAGIPAVLFGPKLVDHGGHAVDESVDWPSVVTSATVKGDSALMFLQNKVDT
jgi:acetylornithine deacetylase